MKKIVFCPKEFSNTLAYSYGGRAVSKEDFKKFFIAKNPEKEATEEALLEFSANSSFTRNKGLFPAREMDDKYQEDFFRFYLEKRDVAEEELKISKEKLMFLELLENKMSEIEELDGKTTNKKFDEKLSKILEGTGAEVNNYSQRISMGKWCYMLYSQGRSEKFSSDIFFEKLRTNYNKSKLESLIKEREELITPQFFEKELKKYTEETVPAMASLMGVIHKKWNEDFVLQEMKRMV